MTREKLKECNNLEHNIQKMVELIEVINSKSLSNERVAGEIIKNPDIFSYVKNSALAIAQNKLSIYEEEFEKL
jgi:hypothetical protein